MTKRSNILKFLGCFLPVLMIAFFCGQPTAVALWVGENIDVHNNTGQVAHDFHMEGTIKSVTPPTLGFRIGYVDNPTPPPPTTPFPSFEYSITHIVDDLWKFRADWSSQDVRPSQVGHFGLFFDVWSRNVMIDKTGWWTDRAGNRIGNGWPVLGFEVPTNWWDDPSRQVFRLQGASDAAGDPVQILQMDLLRKNLGPSAPADSFFDVFTELNVDGMRGFDWIHVDKYPTTLPAGSFFDVFTEPLLGPLRPDDLVIARVLARWPDEPAGRWFFEVHQEHPVPEPVTVVLLSIGFLCLALGVKMKIRN